MMGQSVFRRSLSFAIKAIEKVRQIVGIFHVEISLPAIFNNSGRIRLGIPDGPATFEHSHLVAHGQRLHQFSAALKTAGGE